MELTFSLENFEGPLDLLLYLVQKGELDVAQIILQSLLKQFFAKSVPIDQQGEFLSMTAHLLLLKSRQHLPSDAQLPSEEDEDVRLDMIERILEYSRYKEAAQGLGEREKRVQTTFPREAAPPQKPASVGLNEVSLDELASLLQDILKRADQNAPEVIQDDEISFDDKVLWLKEHVFKVNALPFADLFTSDKGPKELIVLFLALLELMKEGAIKVIAHNQTLIMAETHG